MQPSVMFAVLLALQLAAGSKIYSGASVEKERPVAKVVKMLKDMQDTLADEKKADEKMYKQLNCWCKENREEKGGATKDAETEIKDLQSKVEGMKASLLSLDTEMNNLKAEVKEAEKTMDSARVMNGREMEELHTQQKELSDDKAAVQQATVVIAGGSKSFLQTPKERLQDVAANLQRAISRRATLLDNVLSYDDRDRLDAFIKDPVQFTALLQEKTTDPSGGELTGMFNSMEQEFDEDLKNTIAEAKRTEQTFDELIATKKSAIAAAEDSIDKKRELVANTKTKMFEAEVEVKDKQKNIGADAAFVAMLEEKCSQTDTEWEERQKTRAEEIEAVGKALEVLDSDEALATFGKTYNFLQLAAVDGRRDRAAAILARAGKKHDGRMVMLAVQAKLDGFEKVKAAMDEMLEALKKEMQDDVKQKQFCVDSFNENDANVKAQTAAKDKEHATIEALGEQLKESATKVSVLNGQIAEANKQMELAKANRQKEEEDFRMTVSDQKATQALLKKAIETLKGFYLKAGLMQVEQHREDAKSQPEVPKGFESYKKNANGNVVLNVMQQIIIDTSALEAETERAEQEAVKSHEKLVQTTSNSINAMGEELNNQAETKAKVEQQLAQATKADEGAAAELADLATEAADLHQSCDFLMTNFDMRKTAREEEMEAIRTAKNVLSGMNFLQKK